jgi:metallo-beta-lactamase family protein
MFGEEVPVKARVYTINGFSAHADQRELLDWHRRTGAPAMTFLVHGEPDTMRHFAGRLSGTHVEIPAFHQKYNL